jgi:hypothetical protein
MSAAISNITIGRVDLVTPAGNYNQYGTTSNVVNVNGEQWGNISQIG